MNFSSLVLSAAVWFVPAAIHGVEDNPKPENATVAVLRAFETHNIVMLCEAHGLKQEHDWIRSMVANPQFAERVDDIVMEFGNSLYQKSVDRYVAGEDVPFEQVQKAWLNLAATGGQLPSAVIPLLYQAVRETNLKRRGQHQMRIVCGDPYIDWDKVKGPKDFFSFSARRDEWYAQVVKDEVLARHHRALLIMGGAHFYRQGIGGALIERELRLAGASLYLVDVEDIKSFLEMDHRFNSWPSPVIVTATGWVGDLPMPHQGLILLNPGLKNAWERFVASRMKDNVDALLYLGPHVSRADSSKFRAEIMATPYRKEMERRQAIISEDIEESMGPDRPSEFPPRPPSQ